MKSTTAVVTIVLLSLILAINFDVAESKCCHPQGGDKFLGFFVGGGTPIMNVYSNEMYPNF